MKKFLLIQVLALVSALGLQAQVLPNGYYRVQNASTERYVHIVNDYSSGLDYAAMTADFSALATYKDSYHPADSDPACILELTAVGANYDIKAQGTGVYQLIQHYVSLRKFGTGAYGAYATEKGQTLFVAEDPTYNASKKNGKIISNNGTGLVQFYIKPVDANGEYFGIAPKVECNGKAYNPFYAAFPFSFVTPGKTKAYIITKVDAERGIVVYKQVTGVIPANTPVFIECATAGASNNRLNLGGTPTADVSGNLLAGTCFNYFVSTTNLSANHQVKYDAGTMRRLGVTKAGKLGYIVSNPIFPTTELSYEKKNGNIPANESYLTVPAGSPEELVLMTESEYEAALNVKVASISLSAPSTSVLLGGTLQFTATVTPANATNKSVTWSVSDTNIATIDQNGLLTAKTVGTVTVTATAQDGSGIQASQQVTVNPILVSNVAISAPSTSVLLGGTLQFTATVTPDNATNKSVTWSVSDTNIATIDQNGLLTANAVGTVTVTATAQDGSGVQASQQVTVNPILVSNVAISVPSTSVLLGGTLQFTATVTPDNATNKSVTWSVSDSEVATIDQNGLLTTKKDGTVTVTATAQDGSGVQASQLITVLPIAVEEVRLNHTECSIMDADILTLQLVAEVLPANATYKEIVWTSSDENVVTVDQTGLVSYNGLGEATVTATAVHDNVSASCVFYCTSAIMNVSADDSGATQQYFGVNGTKMSQLQKGLNIVRRGDRVVKVVVR